jgi:hypothetical protein
MPGNTTTETRRGAPTAPGRHRWRYRQSVVRATCLSVSLTVIVGLCSALAPAAFAATPPSPTSGHTTPAERKLLQSHELWATIDVCDPSDEPDTVGIRGSMPGDGESDQKLYMSFRLQYLNTSKQWVDLTSGASSGFVGVGGAMTARQGGTSFELKPVAGQAAVTLRGVVDFEWRHGKTVVLSAARTTAVGHKSLAGADPANFSAATCVIG